jgi:hypothetical protein
MPITPTSRMQIVTLAIADADLPPLFGETVVTGYGSVVIFLYLFQKTVKYINTTLSLKG